MANGRVDSRRQRINNVNSESEIHKRKNDHLALAGSPSCQMNSSNGLETVRFEPVALPELNFAEIDTRVQFVNKPPVSYTHLTLPTKRIV